MIRIEPLRRSDRARWAQLWSEYQLFYAVEIPATVTDVTWQRLHDGRIHGLGAWDSSAVLVGFVHYLFHETRGRRHPPATCRTCMWIQGPAAPVAADCSSSRSSKPRKRPAPIAHTGLPMKQTPSRGNYMTGSGATTALYNMSMRLPAPRRHRRNR